MQILIMLLTTSLLYTKFKETYRDLKEAYYPSYFNTCSFPILIHQFAQQLLVLKTFACPSIFYQTRRFKEKPSRWKALNAYIRWKFSPVRVGEPIQTHKSRICIKVRAPRPSLERLMKAKTPQDRYQVSKRKGPLILFPVSLARFQTGRAYYAN